MALTGCAFACHDGTPVNGYADAYALAKASNIVLRYDAINSGIRALLDKIDGLDPGHQFISTGVYSFDNALTLDSSITTGTASARSHLPAAPAISGMTEGATHFNEIIGRVISTVGPGGDGKSPSNPIKLIILATDGAQDPGRYWTTDIPARDLVGPFDLGFCKTLADEGVIIGIIHTPYEPIPTDWGYLATLDQPSLIGGPGTRADDIPIGLKACAGSRYILADDKASIEQSFATIFQSLDAIRLTQ